MNDNNNGRQYDEYPYDDYQIQESQYYYDDLPVNQPKQNPSFRTNINSKFWPEFVENVFNGFNGFN